MATICYCSAAARGLRRHEVLTPRLPKYTSGSWNFRLHFPQTSHETFCSQRSFPGAEVRMVRADSSTC